MSLNNLNGKYTFEMLPAAVLVSKVVAYYPTMPERGIQVQLKVKIHNADFQGKQILSWNFIVGSLYFNLTREWTFLKYMPALAPRVV